MAPQAMVSSGPSSAAVGSQLDVPQTPEISQAVPATPRTNPTTRQHDIEPDDHESKRARVEASKKQRLDRISADYASMVRSVKFSNDEHFTMDEYDNDLSMDDHVNVDAWLEEESDDTPMDCIPNELWSNQPPDQPPPEPEAWVDRVADHIELSRLCNMNVLVEGNDMQLGATNTLTTKFVYDWRLKDRVQPDGSTVKAWLRRSRLVAREFAFWVKRSDTYAPATSTHILNALPMLYLQSLVDVPEHDKSETKVCLGTVDVKDAFLMVDQPSPMLVTLLGKACTVKKILPGQRLGAKSWYWHLRGFLSKHLNYEWCPEQPCLARNEHCCIMVHVDDILFCGNRAYWNQTFLPKFAETFKISSSVLQGVGSEINFLKRKIQRLEHGLALLPGTSAEKVVQLFEQQFGKVRPQAIPCDGGIQTEDRSDELAPKDAFGYRSVVGTCLYLARDRPDLLSTVKELSGAMSRPTCTALQRLRKLVGYPKATPNYCVLLEIPTGGQGKWHATDQFWLLESFSDSDWSSNQSHRRSTGCGVHMLNGSLLFASSRTQRVVSLSSCESELHAMVSTLSDGIFLRRCIQFVCKCEAEHMMYTDSSSGRQLVMRQGTGKVKHVSGKILWIQDAIRDNVFKLSQIPTIWNISDIGTKSLGVQRVHLLLHEMNVASSSDDFCLIGEPEYHMQSKRHGGRQMTKLAKQIARLLMVMGLESSTLRGVAANPMSDTDNQCSLEPNAYNQYEPFSYTAIFLMTMVFLGVVLFMARTFKWAKDAYKSYEHSYGVMAMTDSLVDRLCNENKTRRGEVNEMKNQIAELQRGHKLLEGQDDILSDQADSLHYGLVML